MNNLFKLFLVNFVLILFVIKNVCSCSCHYESETQKFCCSSYVYVVNVTGSTVDTQDKYFHSVIYNIDVLTNLKSSRGPKTKDSTMRTWVHSSSCGVSDMIEVGRTYLITGRYDFETDEPRISLCDFVVDWEKLRHSEKIAYYNEFCDLNCLETRCPKGSAGSQCPNSMSSSSKLLSIIRR